MPCEPPPEFWPSEAPPPGYGYSFSKTEVGQAMVGKAARTADEREWVKALYSAEVGYVDWHLGRVLENLKRWGIYENSLIVLTSDHGEEFWEHGGYEHGQSLHGELLNVPLCLYEIRMSPQLHTMVYGYHQHSFVQSVRYGGWRPTVFMKHGLKVAMWMTTASLAGLWLWRTRSLLRLCGLPMGFLVGTLFATTIACKSTNGWLLLTMGTVWFFFLRKWPSTWTFWVMLAVPVLYICVRAAGLWDGGLLVSMADSLLGSERAGSLGIRLRMEEILGARARLRPLFGWGNWNFRPTDVFMITDSAWIIRYATQGVVGLTLHLALTILPVGLLMRRFSAATWSHPLTTGPLFFASILILVSINKLANTENSPIYILMVGGLMALRAPVTGRQNA